MPLEMAGTLKVSGDVRDDYRRYAPTSKKEVSNLLRAARTVLGSLANSEIPDPSLIRKIADLKQSMQELLNSETLQSLEASAAQLIEDVVREFPVQLKQFCESNGLYLAGGFPDHIIDGKVFLRIDTKHARVQINDDMHPMFPIADFLNRLQDEVSKFASSEFQASQFLSKLWQAYQLCTSRRKSSISSSRDRVAIFELLQELAFVMQSRQFARNPTREAFRSYSQHTFRADLYRLVTAPVEPVIEGFRLAFEPTSVAEEGLFMFLPSTGRCSFVGHIVFLATE